MWLFNIYCMFRPVVAIIRCVRSHIYSFLKVFCDFVYLMAIKRRNM
jgi:hypothetical protein